MLDQPKELQHYSTNRWAKNKQTRLGAAQRAHRRTAPLVPMRVKCLTESELMKISFGATIVLTTQQLHRISGKGGGQRDP